MRCNQEEDGKSKVMASKGKARVPGWGVGDVYATKVRDEKCSKLFCMKVLTVRITD